MDLSTAIHKDVHAYPGGPEAYAAKHHKKLKLVYSKADPGQPHQYTITETLQYQKEGSTCHTLHAYAAELNHICLPVVDMAGISDTQLLDALLTHSMKFGETRQAILDALHDNEVDSDELQTIRHRMFESMRALAEVYRRLACMAADESDIEAAMEQWAQVAHA